MVNVLGMNSVDGTKLRHKEQIPWQISENDPNYSVCETEGPVNVLDQIQKIRRVLLLDEKPEEAKQHDHRPVGAQEAREKFVKQEISDPREYDDNEAERLSSPQQSLRISKIGDTEILRSSWTRKTPVESEVENLALQVQSLVHQLTTCRQNLVKAEREVNMLHRENMEFRSLLHDILDAFSKS